jgi:hypothetical protein
LLQVLIAIGAMGVAIGGVVMLKSYLDGEGAWLLLLAVVFGILFLWMFGIALRLPTSFVAVSQDRMRIRFGGFVDSIVETSEVSGARLIDWRWWRGLGVRTAFSGDISLVGAWGPVAEVTLKRPVRVWLIPRLWRISATRVVLGVRNPHKLVERFGSAPVAPARIAKPVRTARKGARR